MYIMKTYQLTFCTYNILTEYEIPLFRQGILSLNEVKIGMNLTGQVRNITQFGAFVDVGIGIDALLHISKMKDIYRQIGRDLALGDKVKVTVCNTDIARKRVGVSYVSHL